MAHAEAVNEAVKYPNGLVMQNGLWVQNGFSERQAILEVKRLTFRAWLVLMVFDGLGYVGGWHYFVMVMNIEGGQ